MHMTFEAARALLRPIKRLLIPEKSIEHLLWTWLNGNEVFFVQIGSNDGLQGDPLNKLIRTNPTWRGIFVEPVPSLFARLKNNYPSDGSFAFENVAVAEDHSEKSFYFVSDSAKTELGDKLPFWYDQLGSFDKNHILSHLEGILESYIVEAKVRCLPLDALLAKHNVRKLDLLHIDAEGYDFKILRQLNFDKYQPGIILFEFKHLSDTEKREACSTLRSHGYRLRFENGDCLAQRLTFLSWLRKLGVWQWLAPALSFLL